MCYSSFEYYPAESNGVIIMQLCLALADLYLQVADWTDFIAEILDKSDLLYAFLHSIACF